MAPPNRYFVTVRPRSDKWVWALWDSHSDPDAPALMTGGRGNKREAVGMAIEHALLVADDSHVVTCTRSGKPQVMTAEEAREYAREPHGGWYGSHSDRETATRHLQTRMEAQQS